jgi:hypothetical protein
VAHNSVDSNDMRIDNYYQNAVRSGRNSINSASLGSVDYLRKNTRTLQSTQSENKFFALSFKDFFAMNL